MPKVATHEEEARAAYLDEVALSPGVPTTGKPIFKNVKVVYLGSDPRRSVPLPGRVIVENLENPDGSRHVVKSIGPTSYGFTTHDFWMRDLRGELIRERLMPDNHPIAEVRSKPYCIVEHPDHIFFATARDDNKRPEFKIVSDAATMASIEEYVRALLRRQNTHEALITKVIE